MKWKKLLSVTLAGMMVLSMSACGDSGSGAETSPDKKKDEEGKLVIWTLADDLKQFAEKYKEETGQECDVVVITDNYVTKAQTAILAGEKEPDIIVGEPKMLDAYYESGMMADLDALGAKEFEGKIVDYVWERGKDSEGVQRSISYQITPGGIYYRRDIAEKVFGTQDPEEIGKLFQNYEAIMDTAEKLKTAGYRIFASDAELNIFSNQEPWVVDGKLNLDQTRLDYLDMSAELFNGGYTAYAAQWTAPWYQAMAGEIPVFEKNTNLWDDAEREKAEKNATEKTEIFAYGLPSWGVITMRDNYKETEGLWGVCSGPASGFDGGTYLGINVNSQRKEAAWEFIKFCTLNEDTMEWWLEASKGDTVSYIPTLEKHKDDENKTYGGQKLYQFWQKEAEKIDLSIVTPYDQQIAAMWGSVSTSVKLGQMTKEEAVSAFYDQVEATFPELKVER